MSHVDTPPANDPNTPPAPDPATPPVPNPSPPAVPDPATPPATPPASGDGEDRVTRIETMVTNLTETVGSLLTAITDPASDDAKPQKLPWTAWGSKRNN